MAEDLTKQMMAEKMIKDVLEANNILYSDLIKSDQNLQERIRQFRNEQLKHYVDYSKSMSIIIATIIPFSPLVFSIGSEIVNPNIVVWFFAIIFLLLSLYKLLTSFLFYLKESRTRLAQVILDYSPIDLYIFELEKNNTKDFSEWTTRLVNVYNSQRSLIQTFDGQIMEIKIMVKIYSSIKDGFILFFIGLSLLFVSIFFDWLVSLTNLI